MCFENGMLSSSASCTANTSKEVKNATLAEGQKQWPIKLLCYGCFTGPSTQGFISLNASRYMHLHVLIERITCTLPY